MSKRAYGKFARNDRDFYPTPYTAVTPLIPHLCGVRTFAEPCAGNGALVQHLESHGLRCVYQGDIATGQDALTINNFGTADIIITNPSHQRRLMHALIQHFQKIATTWLLIDQDWAGTKQAVPYLKHCTDILPIGRLIWIEGTNMPGYDNYAWYRFDARCSSKTIFHPYRSHKQENATCLQ